MSACCEPLEREPGAAQHPTGALESARAPLVLVVGNPNVGKTSIFNRLTGERAHVGNYPGITVERREGTLAIGGERSARLVDVPGAYSLNARSTDEQIAVNSCLGLGGQPRPDLVLVVVDAGQLARNLYLVAQLIEAELPLVIALNMIDEVAENPPRPEAVTRALGVPCVATDARHGKGIDELCRSLVRALSDPPHPKRLALPYPAELLRDAEAIGRALPAAWRGGAGRERALALWALGSLDAEDELEGIDGELRDEVGRARARAGARDHDLEIVGARYAFVDGLLPELFRRMVEHPPKRPVSERIDRVLLHPVLGFAFFAGMMLTLFQALFTWANPAIELIEGLVGALQGWGRALLPAGVVTDLVVEGILGGVGNVVVFLPQILLLFLFIGLLEDSGYMARVAFLMDRIMQALGLHGRAFVPLLSGYACAVPAILATRTMERRRDRLLTMLVVPLMTCSARLPVYTLVIAALFPPTLVFGWVPVQGLLMIGMYLFSVLAALGVAFVLGRSVVKGRRVPLILELPPYRMPSVRVTLRAMLERAGGFLREAGTVILAMTVVLWFLLSFPRAGVSPEVTSAVPATPAIETSYAGQLGKAIEPAIAPLGFDWKIGIGLVGAFAAREVFVSTMGLVYGIGDSDAVDAPLRDRMRAETRGDGKPAYTPLVGLSLLVFFALACQCMGTLAVVRRETRSWRWPAFLFAYTGALAWGVSFAVYQGGRLLGF